MYISISCYAAIAVKGGRSFLYIKDRIENSDREMEISTNFPTIKPCAKWRYHGVAAAHQRCGMGAAVVRSQISGRREQRAPGLFAVKFI